LLDYAAHNGGERGGERYVDTLKSKTIETVEREEMYSDANFWFYVTLGYPSFIKIYSFVFNRLVWL
jgi:hypothetical protein